MRLNLITEITSVVANGSLTKVVTRKSSLVGCTIGPKGLLKDLARRTMSSLFLSRSAWSGTSAHGVGLWSGDIDSSWNELQLAVKVGQGVGMSGIPLWTTDIGGYAGGDPENPSFQELIVRWFQFGAFCPLFRLHGHRNGKCY